MSLGRWPRPKPSNARAVIANELRCCSRTSNVSFGSVVYACVGRAVPNSSSQWRQSRKTSADWQSSSSDHRRSARRALHKGVQSSAQWCQAIRERIAGG
jgi:hypothetical protein